MKKILALLIATLMVFSLASCAKDDANAPAAGDEAQNTEENVENNEADANENEASADSEADAADGAVKVLSDVWANLAEDQKFAVGGGDADNMTSDAPGKYDVTLTEDMDASLGLPASEAGNVDDAASLVHMMNANMFTGAAYHLTEGTDAKAFANAFKTNLDGRQWMCGRPEALIAISFDGYVITAFGSQMNVDNFKTAALKLEGASVIIEEAIVE